MFWLRRLLLVALLALVASSVDAAVACTGVGTDNGTGATDSMSVTVGAGSDRALFVFISIDSAGVNINPAWDFNGDSGVQISEEITGYYAYAGVLVAPDVGTFTLSLSGVGGGDVHQWAAVSCTGVDQVTPTDTGNVASGNAEMSTSGAIASATGNLVLSMVGVNNITGPALTSTGSGQTEMYDIGDGNAGLSVATSTGAASVTASYSWTDPRLYTQITFDVNVPAGGGGSTVTCTGLATDTAVGATDTTSVTVASGTDRVMYVGIGVDTTAEAIAPTVDFNGDTVTQIGEHETNYYLWVGRLIAPDVGTLDLNSSTLSGNLHFIAVVVCTGVDQTTPEDTADVQSGTAETSSSSTINSATDNIVLSFLATNNSFASTITSSGTGQTEIYDVGDGDLGLSVARSTGASTRVATFDWTGSRLFVQITFDVNAASGGPPPSTCSGAIFLMRVGGC